MVSESLEPLLALARSSLRLAQEAYNASERHGSLRQREILGARIGEFAVLVEIIAALAKDRR